MLSLKLPVSASTVQLPILPLLALIVPAILAFVTDNPEEFKTNPGPVKAPPPILIWLGAVPTKTVPPNVPVAADISPEKVPPAADSVPLKNASPVVFM